jgi:acyl carrier protein
MSCTSFQNRTDDEHDHFHDSVDTIDTIDAVFDVFDENIEDESLLN